MITAKQRKVEETFLVMYWRMVMSRPDIFPGIALRLISRILTPT